MSSSTRNEDDFSLIAWARTTARDQLVGQGTRLAHVAAVVERAKQLAGVLDPDDRSPLVAAAHLHDVGYASALRTTGLHQLDGARWLRQQTVDRRGCELLAPPNGAPVEADERGFRAELGTFCPEGGPAVGAPVLPALSTGPRRTEV